MKFENMAELEFYDNILQPIAIVDYKNRIVYCNKRSSNFLDIVSDIKYINEDINNIFKFYSIDNEENIKIDFINTKEEKIQVVAAINIYVKINVIICMKDVFIDDKKYKMLLFSSVEVKDKMFDLIHSNKGKSKDSGYKNKFNYTDINDDIMKYDGDSISPKLSCNIINATKTGIIVEKDNVITSINNSAKKMLGYVDERGNKNSYLDKSLVDIVKIEPIEYNDVFVENEYNSSSNVIERKFIRKDGNVVYCEITTMVFNDEGQDYYIYLLRDITNRVKVEEMVINNRNVYAKLLELLPIGVMIHTNNKFESGNRAQEKLLGIDDINTITNKDIYNMIHDDDKALYKKMYFDTYFHGETTDIHELKMIRRDGKIIEVEMIMMRMNCGEDKSIVILTEEITERKRAQIDKLKLEHTIKYDKLKTEFISNVSHELKTPLNIILSTIQLLQYNYKDSGDEQLNKYLDLTKINSYRLLRLINNLIDGTRIDVGNLKMNFRNYNIVKIVEDITMAAVEYVEDKGVNLTFDTNVEEKIIGVDKENIERIVLNLLSNAVKFSKENGNIDVQVNDLGDIVQIRVKDNGKGISEEDQKKIFDKFVQAEDLFTRSHEGSGVGLSLVKSIVENHGGNIYVDSKLDEGSEFIVELPNILSKKSVYDENYNIDQVSSIERVKLEFSDIYM